MSRIHETHLDLNLFRVLLAVADTGSVTLAAARLYLTQSAVSAAMGRLQASLGVPLVARQGRGVVLTERGAQLVQEVRPHLEAMVKLSLEPAQFDARTSERTLRLGLSDFAEEWLLPALLQVLARTAPRMRLICTPIQFRTVAEAFSRRQVELAVSHADELPPTITRSPLLRTHFVCLFDPRHVRLGARPSTAVYLAQEHVIVSYNGDLSGVVEEMFGLTRRVRCSVASFSAIGGLVDGSALVATVPEIVARQIVSQRKHLRTAAAPFEHLGGGVDLLWPTALEGDQAARFVCEAIRGVARGLAKRPTASAGKTAAR